MIGSSKARELFLIYCIPRPRAKSGDYQLGGNGFKQRIDLEIFTSHNSSQISQWYGFVCEEKIETGLQSEGKFAHSAMENISR